MESYKHLNNDMFGEYIKDLSGSELKNALVEKKKHEITLMVTRQTDYDYDTAREKLEAVNGNYLKIIKEFLNPDTCSSETESAIESTSSTGKSVNQTIYSEIRNFMDTSCRQYQARKEYTEKMMKFYEEQQKKKLLDASNNEA